MLTWIKLQYSAPAMLEGHASFQSGWSIVETSVHLWMFHNMDKLTKGMLVLYWEHSTLCIRSLFKSKIWLVGCQYGIESSV